MLLPHLTQWILALTMTVNWTLPHLLRSRRQVSRHKSAIVNAKTIHVRRHIHLNTNKMTQLITQQTEHLMMGRMRRKVIYPQIRWIRVRNYALRMITPNTLEIKNTTGFPSTQVCPLYFSFGTILSSCKIKTIITFKWETFYYYANARHHAAGGDQT